MADLSIAIRFPAGRYHATAWGHHVNEGTVDWPPSPWRLLRALVATWHNRAPDIPRDTMARLVEALGQPPAYRVPAYTKGHTRHYMPKNTTDPSDRIMVFDAFVAVAPSDPLLVQWRNAELDGELADALTRLLSCMTYLGRAESWCEAELHEGAEADVSPDAPNGGGTPTSLLTLTEQAGLDELEQDTATLRKRRANRPQGTSVVRYQVPRPVDVGWTAPPPAVAAPTTALLSLNGTVLPSICDAIEIGDHVRSALLSLSGNNDAVSPVFKGRDENDRPLTGHRHGHFVPDDRDGDARLDHLWIHAPMGLDGAALEAVASFRILKRRPYPLQIGLVGLGQADRFEGHPMIGPSRVWESRTPFLLNRHPKKRRGELVDGPEAQLRRELASRGLPTPTRIEPVPRLELGRSKAIRWIEFRRWRRRKQPALPDGHGFRITFDEPVWGPIALGFGSHFGLGAFRASDQ